MSDLSTAIDELERAVAWLKVAVSFFAASVALRVGTSSLPLWIQIGLGALLLLAVLYGLLEERRPL